MISTRGSAGVGVGCKRLTTLTVLVIADDQIARHQVHLFPVLMIEGGGGIDARFEPQQASPTASSINFIQAARKNFLLDPVGVTRRHFPTIFEIKCMELIMCFVDTHPRTLGIRIECRAVLSLCRQSIFRRISRRCNRFAGIRNSQAARLRPRWVPSSRPSDDTSVRPSSSAVSITSACG